jgi:WD40 repeat protein
VVHVLDRHGEQTRLEGHTGGVTCLQYSLDGKYLASGSDNSIRLWRMTSESAAAAHSSPSDESRSRGTTRGPLRAQSDITLLGHGGVITALDFSPNDSNLLASGCGAGEIKLWNVMNQVCIHAFNPGFRRIRAIYFSPGYYIQCYAVTGQGRMIRIARDKMMEFASTILEEPYLGIFPLAALSPCGTCFAAISYMSSVSKCELALFDLRTMAKTQSVFLFGGRDDFGGIAMSPDGKKLAISNNSGGALFFECHDLTIQKSVDNLEQRSDEADVGFCPVAFDPTSRFFAVGRLDGKVELRRTI